VYLVLGGAASIVVLLLAAGMWIGLTVQSTCQQAQQQYESECVTALSQLLDDEAQSYKARNDAIWALGQLGDYQALPVLEKYYTGDIPEREPLAQTLSQYELKKAIRLVSGSSNITAPLWWGLFN
jgi:hypothetical protein